MSFSELGLDPETDWCDTLHLNYSGALKLSAYFAEALTESVIQ